VALSFIGTSAAAVSGKWVLLMATVLLQRLLANEVANEKEKGVAKVNQGARTAGRFLFLSRIQTLS